MSRTVATDEAPAAVGPYSQAKVSNGLVFTAGQIALTANDDDLTDSSPATQAEQCLRNLEQVLEAAGSSLAAILKTTVYLADIDDYDDVNEAYAAFFEQDPPARSAVEVANLPKGAAVEIEAIAAVG